MPLGVASTGYPVHVGELQLVLGCEASIDCSTSPGSQRPSASRLDRQIDGVLVSAMTVRSLGLAGVGGRLRW